MGISGADFIKENYSNPMNIELPDNATVKNVREYFNFSLEKGYAVIINSRIAKNIDVLNDGMVVTIVQTVYGG